MDRAMMNLCVHFQFFLKISYFSQYDSYFDWQIAIQIAIVDF